MEKLILFHVLLLPPCWCFFESEVALVKTIRSEPDVTPVCNNATLTNITLIVCTNITEMSSGEKCRLLYKHGGNFSHECDSRFTLREYNQTVFLHLTSLTPEDSGNYRCECSHSEGTEILYLNITVEGKLEFKDVTLSIPLLLLVACIGGSLLTIITTVFLGFICSKIRHGISSWSPTTGSPVTPRSLDVDLDDPYTSLQHRAEDLYQTISPSAGIAGTGRFDDQEVEDPNSETYENI